MSRHMFFSANTPDGFFECFDDILFPDEAQRIIYLKGSSGSGKSTLMKRAAAAFETAGSAVDYIHCSNNADDLDGICVREYGVCVLDATAPHTRDPVLPGALGEIVNLADYIDSGHIAKYKSELAELSELKKPFFERAYRYLKAAKAVSDNSRSIRESCRDNAGLRKIIAGEIAPHKPHTAEKAGRQRRMFASAVTPQGYVSRLDTLVGGYETVRVYGEDGACDILLFEIEKAAREGGIDTEVCLNPFDISRIEHLFIPALKTCWLTANEFNPETGAAPRVLDLNSLCMPANGQDGELSFNSRVFRELLDKAMQTMAEQKSIHDKIEKIYISCIDYNGVNDCTERLIRRLTALPRLRS